MSYLVLARKYRPQTFSQVVKQEHVTRTLANAIEAGRMAHAILFSGPRGTGKTTVARILAKAMNCEKGPTPVPCNACRSCTEITAGKAADVFEIDGASNNGVEQIRDLRENVKYVPVHSPYKIYIIDEVHMLSIAAFNALLKTLEEPPAHVLFMLATTEPHKVPVTILSRCQRHDFRRVELTALVDHLATISTREGIPVARESLELIAREAGGSIRDSLSLLDQVLACSDGEVRHADVLNVLGVVDRSIIFDISAAVLKGDIPGILAVMSQVHERGLDLKKLYGDLLEHFRNMLLVKMGDACRRQVDLPAHEIERIAEQAGEVSAAFLHQLFEILFREEVTVKLAVRPKLALEMVFLRLSQVRPVLSMDMLIERIDRLKEAIAGAAGDEVPAIAVPESITGNAGSAAGGPDPGRALEKSGEGQGAAKPAAEADHVSAVVMPDPGSGDLETLWQNVLDILGKDHPALCANLKNSRLKAIAGAKAEIQVEGSQFTVNLVRRDKNRAILRQALESLLGRETKLIIHAQADQTETQAEKKRQEQDLKQTALNHPLVAEAIEIFDGKVVDVKIR